MRCFILAAIAAAITLGVGGANAATAQSSLVQKVQHTYTHKPNYYNFTEGGGG
jgi:hypothetical protein